MRRLSFHYFILCSALVSFRLSADAWQDQIAEKGAGASPVIVQNRVVSKHGRFQLSGPSLGDSERSDFYHYYYLALGLRFHFTETHSWEIARGLVNAVRETDAAAEVRARTGLTPDAQTSTHSISSAYVFTPIYGKYAWNERSLVHFDIYGLLGGGLRFSRDNQIFAETGVGMNHYLTPSLSFVPEIRVRFYGEKRTQPTFVTELFLQAGVAWLF